MIVISAKLFNKGVVVGLMKNTSDANLTYTSLGYANGPGGLRKIRTHNLTNQEVGECTFFGLFLFDSRREKFEIINLKENKNYIQESAVYRRSETHGGEDVPIYATGPMSYLFRNTVEQTFIFDVMTFATCM